MQSSKLHVAILSKEFMYLKKYLGGVVVEETLIFLLYCGSEKKALAT